MKPDSDRGSHGVEIGPEAVVSSHLDDGPERAGRRHSELVALALHDQHRHRHGVELGQPTLRCLPARAARREYRKREAEHTDRARGLGRPARDAGTERPAADDEREDRELVLPQVVDDRRPRGVELPRRGRRASPGDAIRLLDEHDAEAFLERRVLRSDQVPRRHASPGTVAEHQRGARLFHGMQVRACWTVRSLDLERRHAAASSGSSPKRSKSSGMTKAVISLIDMPSNVITSMAAAAKRPVSASSW